MAAFSASLSSSHALPSIRFTSTPSLIAFGRSFATAACSAFGRTRVSKLSSVESGRKYLRNITTNDDDDDQFLAHEQRLHRFTTMAAFSSSLSSSHAVYLQSASHPRPRSSHSAIASPLLHCSAFGRTRGLNLSSVESRRKHLEVSEYDDDDDQFRAHEQDYAAKATFSSSLSSSHALIGLGCNEYGQTSCQQKCELMAVPRGQRNVIACRLGKGAATWLRARLSVHNPNMSSEDSGDTRVRILGGDSHNAAASQITSLSTKQANATTELSSILRDEVRPKLLTKLSEANQYIRHLQRELRDKEDALKASESEFSAMEMELQALVHVVQEISRQGIKPGTRKINGCYIHSHLASRLEELQKILRERIKDTDQVRARSIDLVYYEMAEDVQVMGAFNGWIRGEQMSPEYTGTFTKFTASIKLRPGRYEIKFLVDGEWHVSPDLPTVGEGLTMNNLLIVDRN